jgi:hypothetical protein
MQDGGIEFDAEALMGVLGLPTHLSDEERGIYWFQYERPDGIVIIIDFARWDRKAGVLVLLDERRVCSSINLSECSSVRVLDETRRIVELRSVTYSTRCLVSLAGDDIVDVNIEAPSI